MANVRATRTGEKGKGTRINTVARAARLLLLIASSPPEDCTASKIARALGTSAPASYHMLATLLDAKLLYRDEAKCYHLGFHVGYLGEAYRRQYAMPPELQVQLQELAARTGESVYFSAWREGEIQIVARMSGSHAVQVANLQPGFGGASHARASGKVLLAYADAGIREAHLAQHPLVAVTEHTITYRDKFERELELVRRQGYSTEEREFANDVACVAVPVLADLILLGAYTISAPFSRYRKMRRTYITQLQQAAAEATRSLA
jgi:IclR family acetate operon transcriptional repressor